ncbi:MAG: formate dehydrogenase accessory sulfurtransferase FdhD [Phycisphaeraceae bacterium]
MTSTNLTTTTRNVIVHDHGTTTPRDDSVAVEEPLEIRLGDISLAVTMRTPGHDEELAAGFCLTEGIVSRAEEITGISPCPAAGFGNVAVVTLTEEGAARRSNQVQRSQRELYLSSSCGLCGKQSIDRIVQQVPPIRGRFTLARDTLAAMPQTLRQAQTTFDATGGLHGAGLFTPQGKLLVVREDIGRHNAVDKVIGWALLRDMIPLDQAVLLVSGRASFEIMQKAAMAGLAVVAAVSAPSSLAVDFAARTGMTLIGFLREGRMNVYHGEGRVTNGADEKLD